MLINLVTMSLPIACLIISRDVLGLDDPLSDNISANVIGLVLGLGARFYLFRRFVFRRPVTPANDVVRTSEPRRHQPPLSTSEQLGRGPIVVLG